MPKPPDDLNQISSLLQIVADLRGPEGCPWDKEQTHTSLTKYAIEETFEFVEAVESGHDQEMCGELGDVLFQVALHAQLAKERGAFEFQDVVRSIAEKIVRRHPHVFAGLANQSTEEVIKRWDEIKKAEKAKLGKKSETKDVFGIPAHLPALQAAHKIGEKTERLDFDWDHPKQIVRQLKLEIAELEEALDESVSTESFDHIEHELGDVLFTMAQLCRKLKIEPEGALRKMNRRFQNRFHLMIEKTNGHVEKFKTLDRSDKEALWVAVKKEVD